MQTQTQATQGATDTGHTRRHLETEAGAMVEQPRAEEGQSSQNCKQQGRILPLGTLRGSAALQHLDLGPLASRRVRESTCAV